MPKIMAKTTNYTGKDIRVRVEDNDQAKPLPTDVVYPASEMHPQEVRTVTNRVEMWIAGQVSFVAIHITNWDDNDDDPGNTAYYILEEKLALLCNYHRTKRTNVTILTPNLENAVLDSNGEVYAIRGFNMFH